MNILLIVKDKTRQDKKDHGIWQGSTIKKGNNK